ncbi:unnamed protein product [Ectocarpus sp. 6 AP-2014]
MEHGLGDFAWESVEELGVGLDSQKTLAESIRAKTLEFEREREAYIDAAKQLLTPPPPPAAEPPTAAGTGGSAEEESNKSSSGGGEVEEGRGVRRLDNTPGGNADGRRRLQLRRHRSGRGAAPKASSVREAREEQRLASEEIRTLQNRKSDAKVRLQAERLSNLEHGLELGVLRLERLLDRERILELLRLTDPDRAEATRAAGMEAFSGGGGGTTGRGGTADENVYGGGGGGGGGEDDEEVSEEVVEQLEERVAEAEERVRVEASRVGAAVAVRLEERARREQDTRREEALARDEVLRLQTALRGKEERLANTVVSYLELRHAMLRAQRVASEAREDAKKGRAADEEEMRNCRSYTAYQVQAITERVKGTCEDVESELHRQVQLRKDEVCMLREQRAEAEELYEARAVRLESLLEEWKGKHAALRRRFSLETEGFRRDADNIGRRFERIRAGPPGGRPAISSRSGSSARLAVERAFYPRAAAGSGGTAAAGVFGQLGGGHRYPSA